VRYGSDRKKKWKCQCGNIFIASPNNRTNRSNQTSCPCCAEYGYRPNKEGWIYLVEKENEQKVGISNVPKTRLATHKRNGFRVVEVKGPIDGAKIWSIESIIKEWLKGRSLAIPGTQENWHTDAFRVFSLVELGMSAGLDEDDLRLLS
jgi:hypothetical protein